jgi:hypothetical protein
MIITEQNNITRRQFVSRSALLTGGISLSLNSAASGNPVAEKETAFSAYQQRRRAALWSLLGDLPWQHEPAPPKLVRTEEHDQYTLERLVLDLNGIEPVPALLLIPKQLKRPAPGLLFIHWHAGMYGLGKGQLLKGTGVQPAYAPVLAEMGVVTLAIDSWCFGERQHDTNGHRGEEDAFKLMLWRGQVLWGMMMFDEFRAFSYLASRLEVDRNSDRTPAHDHRSRPAGANPGQVGRWLRSRVMGIGSVDLIAGLFGLFNVLRIASHLPRIICGGA